MRQDDVMDLLVLKKKQYSKLSEALDLTEQLAQAVDRQDQVSVQMLVAMRQEPIDTLSQLEISLREKRERMQEADKAKYAALLDGASPANTDFEQMLIDQTANNRRVLERVLELDRKVNRSLGGKDSIYVQEPPETR